MVNKEVIQLSNDTIATDEEYQWKETKPVSDINNEGPTPYSIEPLDVTNKFTEEVNATEQGTQEEVTNADYKDDDDDLNQFNQE